MYISIKICLNQIQGIVWFSFFWGDTLYVKNRNSLIYLHNGACSGHVRGQFATFRTFGTIQIIMIWLVQPVYNAYLIADVYHIRYSLKTCYIRMQIQQNAYHINLSFWLLPGTLAKPSVKLSSAYTRNVQWTIRVLHII